MRKDHPRYSQKPANKATMDEPQEEFIGSEPSDLLRDKEHGNEAGQATRFIAPSTEDSGKENSQAQ